MQATVNFGFLHNHNVQLATQMRAATGYDMDAPAAQKIWSA